jgi:hypothetical protein
MKINRVLDTLASVQLTLLCLGLAMGLVVLGTVAQVHVGTFAAQKEYFNSAWIYSRIGDWKFPFFPGGLTVGALWMTNLAAAFMAHFQFRRHDTGILTSHVGLIVLLLGQFLTQMLSHESTLAIEVGQTKNYSERFNDVELALVMVSDPAVDHVTSIPYHFLSHEGPIALADLPFSLVIQKFYPNAQLEMAKPGQASPATQGIGMRIAALSLPLQQKDDDLNVPAAYVEVLERGGKSLGTWLVSTGLGAPQSFQVQGKEYRLFLRPRRQYYPFALTLKAFTHDLYPGTDIPKNFASAVHVDYVRKGESRDALIYMNHPLRYEGKTFYQASFGQGDRLSILQVVENPVSWAPYIACTLVILGLAIQFSSHLFDFLKERR